MSTIPPAAAVSTVDPDAGQDALNAALDWTKVSTGVAAGALVFGVGLLNGSATYNSAVRWYLFLAWIALGVAILSGIVAQSAIPPMIAEKNYNLEFPPYTWPARFHQLAWLLGIVMLALALHHILFGSPALNSLKVTDAQQAISAALPSVPSARSVQKTSLIELIKGADPSDPSAARWHVQFLLTPAKASLPTQPQDAVDVIVDPVSARATAISR